MNAVDLVEQMPDTPSGRKKPGKRTPYGVAEVVKFVSDAHTTPDVVELTLPMMPLSVNAAFSNSKRGGRHESKDYETWKAAVDKHLAKHFAPVLGTPYRATMTGPVCALFVVRKPDNRRRDLDNTLKSLGDTLTRNFILKDDSQIVDLHIRWATEADKFDGQVKIEIRKQGA